MNSKVLFDYKGKQIENYLVSRYGQSKVELSKLLLSHPLFDIMVREGPCLSLETYLRRYFSILLTIGSQFIVAAAQASGLDFNYNVDDDVFCSIARYQLGNIKKRMLELNLLKPVAASLPSYGVNKFFHQHADNIQLDFYKTIQVELFLQEVENLDGAMDNEDIESLITDLRELMAQKDREIFLEISLFGDLVLALRKFMREGPIGGVPSLDSLKASDLRTVSRLKCTSDMMAAEDLCITGSYKDDAKLESIKEDLEEMADEAGKSLVWDTSETDKKFKCYATSNFDIFTLINSKWVPDAMTGVEFCLKECLDTQSKPGVIIGQRPKTVSDTKGAARSTSGFNSGNSSSGNVTDAVQFLKTHITSDQNAAGNELLGYMNDPEAAAAWEAVSKGFKRDFLRVIPTGFKGELSEVLCTLSDKIQKSQPKLSAFATQISVGAIYRARNQFRLDGTTLERVGQANQ